jgi:hypothetical protein
MSPLLGFATTQVARGEVLLLCVGVLRFFFVFFIIFYSFLFLCFYSPSLSSQGVYDESYLVNHVYNEASAKKTWIEVGLSLVLMKVHAGCCLHGFFQLCSLLKKLMTFENVV